MKIVTSKRDVQIHNFISYVSHVTKYEPSTINMAKLLAVNRHVTPRLPRLIFLQFIQIVSR